MIPRRLHHVWLREHAGDEPGEFLVACRKQALAMHPSWLATEHTEPDLLDHPTFVHIAGPLRAAWDRFAGKPTARSDLYRMLALYFHGGIFLDHDVWPIRPFGDLLDTDLILAADRYHPLLVGEHVMGSVPRNPKLMKIIWRFITSLPTTEGRYGPRLTRWVIESGLGASSWTVIAPEVFCPAGRIVDTEDEAYRVFPQTRALHCWSRFPDGRDVVYDVNRLRSLSPEFCPA